MNVTTNTFQPIGDLLLVSLLNNLTLIHFAHYYAVCVIRSWSDEIYLNKTMPMLTLSVDEENFEESYQYAVDLGCQGFIVSETAFTPFLDLFIAVHDQSDQRSSAKRLITVMNTSSLDALNQFKDHRAIIELPELLFICPEEQVGKFAYHTTKIFNNGSRSAYNVAIEPIWPPDYFPDKFVNMNGFPIKLCSLMYPPYVYYAETTPELANARYDPAFKQDDVPLFLDGTEPTLILEFCSRYNCTVEASFDEAHFWGNVYDNGTGNGLLGAVVERRADMAVAAIYYWRKPYEFSTYTQPISRSGITVLVPKPRMLAPWRTPFLSFAGSLWIAVFVAFCAGTIAVWLIEKGRFTILQPANESPITISDAMLTMIGFYMEQSARMRTDMISCTFLTISLLFAGFMVGNSYGGGLAGVMTLPQYEKPIDTTYDLAASGTLYAGEALSWIFSILYAPQPHMKILVKNYRVEDMDHLIAHSKSHDLGYIGERTEACHFVPASFVDNEASTMLQLLKDDLYWESVVAIVTKTCPFRQAFNDFIMQVKQSGVQMFWEIRSANRYLHTIVQQNIWNARASAGDDEVVKLTISHFLGAYLILSIGCSLASISFMVEYFHSKIAKYFNRITSLFKPEPRSIESDTTIELQDMDELDYEEKIDKN
ncbi:glutamate receptor 3-like [Uranotaenia lowii]|uniref:glutamate receptor 3-like n=1 Tax=Uranotaenia lowii TaxID=190385 RepID=UPI002479F10E|nr:glutamate receptor 3-like [Uranotaenia lowii]